MRTDSTEGRYQGTDELDRVDLAFELSGTLTALAVAPGQTVQPGDVVGKQDDALDREQREIRVRELDVARSDLALIRAGSRKEDVRATRAQLNAAIATERSLVDDLARERALANKGALAGAHLGTLDAALARARGERTSLEEKLQMLTKGARTEEIGRALARVQLAEQALALEDKRREKRALTTRAGGTVEDTYVDPGEIAAAGATVATIVDRRQPYADVFVPVVDAPRFRIGAPVEVMVEGLAAPTPGVVERVAPRAEFTPRFVYSPRERPSLMIRVRLRLTDETGALHAGLPAYARLRESLVSPPGHAP